jgi:hypothetical protein
VNTVGKQTYSNPPSNQKAIPSPLHRSRCLSGLLAAVESGEITREQARKVTSVWQKEYQEFLARE